MAGRWRALAALSLAELFALSLWFSASAVLPALSREWSLGASGRAGLTIAVQLGFIVGTLASALGNLPDVWSPRLLMLGSIVAGVVANTTLALAIDGLGPALALRFVTGLAMAGSYPPAIRRQLLSKYFLISTMPEGALDDLVKFTTVARFDPHRVIFSKGDKGDCLYGILLGRVRIYFASSVRC